MKQGVFTQPRPEPDTERTEIRSAALSPPAKPRWLSQKAGGGEPDVRPRVIAPGALPYIETGLQFAAVVLVGRTVMNNKRKVLVAGLGAMTPAFIATDQVRARAAECAAIEPAQSSAPSMALDQDALKSALLELSPAEKLRIAGDRIRLAAKAKTSTESSRAVLAATRKLPCIPPVTVRTCGGAPRKAR